jgi:hypothetical protein
MNRKFVEKPIKFVDHYKGEDSYIGYGGVQFFKKDRDDFIKYIERPATKYNLTKMKQISEFLLKNHKNFYNGKNFTNISDENFTYDDLMEIQKKLDLGKNELFYEFDLENHGKLNLNKLLDRIPLTQEEKKEREKKEVKFSTVEKERDRIKDLIERFQKEFFSLLGMNVFLEKVKLNSYEYASQVSKTSKENLKGSFKLSLADTNSSSSLSSLGDLTEEEDNFDFEKITNPHK